MEPRDHIAGTSGSPGRPDDGAWVLAARAGDPDAFGRLFDRWFDPVYDVAWRIVRNRDTAAEVAQDVFLAAWEGLDRLEQPNSFGGWVRRIARNRALNRLDRERRSLPDDEQAVAELDRSAPEVDMTSDLGDQEQRELVWAAASALGDRDSSLLDLHLRHGLSAGEIAGELGVTTNNAHQLLHRLKGKLAGAVRAWVLWRNAGRRCHELDAAITAAGLTVFGADAVRLIGRHAERCDDCTERQQLRLAPEALFAAMPIMVAPPVLKAEAVAALSEAGVPMAGASAAGAAPGVGAEGAGGPGAGGSESGAGGPGAGGSESGAGTAPVAESQSPPPEPPGDGAGAAAAPDDAPGAPGSKWRVAVAAGVAAVTMVIIGLTALSAGGPGGGGQDQAAPGSSAPSEAGVDVPAPSVTPEVATSASTTSEPTTPTTAAGTTSPPVDPEPPPPPPPPDTEPPPPAPEIVRFVATVGESCTRDTGDGVNDVVVAWASTDADNGTIEGGPDGTISVKHSDALTWCMATDRQTTLVLTVAGPGGTAEASVSVGGPPASLTLGGTG